MGIDAVGKAGLDFPLGTVGAGYGAMTGMGKLKGGLGSASIAAANGATVGALVAVNSLGAVVAPGTRAFWATPYEIDGEFGNGGAAALAQLRAQGEDWMVQEPQGGRKNTTLACIATDLALTRVELKRVAIMAQDGMARAIRPLHSPFDGDVVFALSTGQREVQGSRELAVLQIGALAADTLARAIARGVYAATPWPGSQVATWRTLGGQRAAIVLVLAAPLEFYCPLPLKCRRFPEYSGALSPHTRTGWPAPDPARLPPPSIPCNRARPAA